MADFLLEIGVEEIPDRMIDAALTSLRDRFSEAAGLLNGTIEVLDATPRRLVLIATSLDSKLTDVNQAIQGPYVSAGEKAARGFAAKNNTTVDDLHRELDAKGERYFFSTVKKGESASELLTRITPELIIGIPWPKAMHWTGSAGMRFIRPIRWVLALLNDEVIPVEIAGVKSGNTTRGHRVLGSKQPLPVTIESYERVLRENGVLLRAADRLKRIQDGLGPDVSPDDELLGTLTYLTEFPTAIRGSFDESYLTLPKEILTTVMRHHQRYFSILNPDGGLAPAFVAVANTDSDPDGLIRQGNEQVLRARFNDARFFWQVDQQKRLIQRVDDLAKVTFQAKLGNYKDKAERMRAIARELAQKFDSDINVSERAALLAKCDLTTEMVKEFTDLQGIVGGLYAQAQGEGGAVGTAIYDHYKPVGLEDSIPRNVYGQIVSLADKLDTLRECFRIGLIPSGSKDPFALRRAAQGIVKILFEARLAASFKWIAGDVPELPEFLLERIQFYLREKKGYAYDEVAALMAAPITTLPDLADRADAIHYVRPTEDFEPLAASFKRIKNILKQAGAETHGAVVESMLQPGPEQMLYKEFVRVREITGNNTSYRDTLSAIASLRPQVDLFFDKILVNDPDPKIRENRLALLNSLLTEFSTIADFSEIVTRGASA